MWRGHRRKVARYHWQQSPRNDMTIQSITISILLLRWPRASHRFFLVTPNLVTCMSQAECQTCAVRDHAETVQNKTVCFDLVWSCMCLWRTTGAIIILVRCALRTWCKNQAEDPLRIDLRCYILCCNSRSNSGYNLYHNLLLQCLTCTSSADAFLLWTRMKKLTRICCQRDNALVASNQMNRLSTLLMHHLVEIGHIMNCIGLTSRWLPNKTRIMPRESDCVTRSPTNFQHEKVNWKANMWPSAECKETRSGILKSTNKL